MDHHKAYENIYRGTLIRVIDGDSLIVNLHLGLGVVLEKQRIRLKNVYAPEIRDEHGADCKDYLEALLSESFTVITHQMDKYGRHVSEIITDFEISVNKKMCRYIGTFKK